MNSIYIIYVLQTSPTKEKSTTMCHFDDAKMSHVNPKVVDGMINLLESHFWKIKETRGKVHKFLGTKTLHEENSMLSTNMIPRLVQCVDKLGETHLKAATPANANPFVVDDYKTVVN